MRLFFSGSRALITGGSCQIALFLAELLMDEGIFPILTARSKESREKISEHLSAYPGEFGTVHLDLANPESMDEAFSYIGDELDYLIDFAQSDYESLIASADSRKTAEYLAENISSRAELVKMAARVMLKKRSGRLIFISSTAANLPNPGQGFYAASKLASEGIYRNLGIEMAGRGITTLCLRPGYVDAGRGEAYLRENSREALKMVPTKKALGGEEVAETILFFLSESARGFNATEIIMDGGLSAGK